MIRLLVRITRCKGFFQKFQTELYNHNHLSRFLLSLSLLLLFKQSIQVKCRVLFQASLRVEDDIEILKKFRL